METSRENGNRGREQGEVDGEGQRNKGVRKSNIQYCWPSGAPISPYPELRVTSQPPHFPPLLGGGNSFPKQPALGFLLPQVQTSSIMSNCLPAHTPNIHNMFSSFSSSLPVIFQLIPSICQVKQLLSQA